MESYADLHIHTRYSDGDKNPREIFMLAEEAGLAAISLTDHDTIDGCIEALEIQKEFNVDFIIGIELSCYENGREYHILGYNLEPDNKNLMSHLDDFREARLYRAEKILKKLNHLDIPITFDSILEIAGKAPIARPHIAWALQANGFTTTMKEAFNLYLGEGKPAYEAKANFSTEKAIKLINESGGVSVLAHPARTITQEALFSMIEKGLDGIECIHPMHDAALEKFYRGIARQYWLLETGGSDYHGTRDFDHFNFGKFVVPASVVESIRVTAANSK